MEKKPKRVGRPSKPPIPGERVSLGLRVTADIKRKLDDEAAKSGRSQSQEAELRLERSFQQEEIAERLLASIDKKLARFAEVVKEALEGSRRASGEAKRSGVHRSAREEHEVGYFAKKHGVSKEHRLLNPKTGITHPGAARPSRPGSKSG